MSPVKHFIRALCLLAGCVPLLANPLVTTTNLLLNPGAEAGSLTNWTAGGVSNPKLDSGTFDPGINPHSGTNDFLGGTGATGSLAQVVSLVGNQDITVAAIDGGGLLTRVSFWEQSFNQSPADGAYVSLAFWDSTSNVISTVATPEVASAANFAWSNSVALFKIPAGTRFVQYTMNFVRHNGSDLDAFVDDNSLIVFDAALVPQLNIVLTGAAARIFWPTNFADGFTLQQNTNLATTNWTTSGYTITPTNGTNSITITPPVGSLFFRLKQ
jgi:hypothetical protein